MVMGFYPRSSGVYSEGELKGRQRLRICDMSIILQDLEKGAIQLLVRIAIRKASFSNAVEDGKIGSRVFFCGCFPTHCQSFCAAPHLDSESPTAALGCKEER